MSRIRSEILEVFRIRFGVEGEGDELLQLDYLEQGLVDSMGLIELVEDLEERFDLRFSAAELQSKEFQTIGGLTRLIERRLSVP